MPRLSKLLAQPYLLLAFAPLCWAGNMIVGRAVRGEIPPLSINWWRWSLAALVLLAFTAPELARQRQLLLKHWKLVLLLALTGVTGFHSAVYIGLTMTTAVNSALIVGMGPVLIVPLARVILGERVTPLQGLGVAVSTLGAVIVILRGEVAILLELSFNGGDLWLLFASTLWASYSVLLKRKPPALEVMALTTAVVLTGALLTTPLYLWEMSQGRFVPLTAESVAAIGYVSLFAGVLAYIAWNRGVGMVGPNKAGLFLHLLPVYGALLAALILGEQLRAYHFAGFGLILSGLVLTTRYGPKRPYTKGPWY
ncbi:MAG: DMT family transporter [Rhodospirillales bacterium]|nr:DMT family transporter [Rhodospirillales bacterium]